MLCNISSDDMKVTAAMKVFINQRIITLERHLSDQAQETVALKVIINTFPQQKFIAKIHAAFGKNEFFSEKVGFEYQTAVIDCIADIDRQYLEAKEKLLEKRNK